MDYDNGMQITDIEGVYASIRALRQQIWIGIYLRSQLCWIIGCIKSKYYSTVTLDHNELVFKNRPVLMVINSGNANSVTVSSERHVAET